MLGIKNKVFVNQKEILVMSDKNSVFDDGVTAKLLTKVCFVITFLK